MKQIITNISPNTRQAAIDSRTVATSAHQAHRTTTAQPKPDPIRAVIVANLAFAGIVTNGKTDEQLLEDYRAQIVRTKIEQVFHAEQRARQLEADAFSGYSLNAMLDKT